MECSSLRGRSCVFEERASIAPQNRLSSIPMWRAVGSMSGYRFLSVQQIKTPIGCGQQFRQLATSYQRDALSLNPSSPSAAHQKNVYVLLHRGALLLFTALMTVLALGTLSPFSTVAAEDLPPVLPGFGAIPFGSDIDSAQFASNYRGKLTITGKDRKDRSGSMRYSALVAGLEFNVEHKFNSLGRAAEALLTHQSDQSRVDCYARFNGILVALQNEYRIMPSVADPLLQLKEVRSEEVVADFRFAKDAGIQARLRVLMAAKGASLTSGQSCQITLTYGPPGWLVTW